MKIYSSTGTWLTHPSLPDLPWDNDRTGVHGVTSATSVGLATILRCACGHETSGASPEDAFAAMVAHAETPRCKGCGWDEEPDQMFEVTGEDVTEWYCAPCLPLDLDVPADYALA